MKSNFPFHMVTISPWPIIMSINLMNLLLRIILWIYMNNLMIMIFNFLMLTLSSLMWFRDIVPESTFQGMHSLYILSMLKYNNYISYFSIMIFYFIFFFFEHFFMI